MEPASKPSRSTKRSELDHRHLEAQRRREAQLTNQQELTLLVQQLCCLVNRAAALLDKVEKLPEIAGPEHIKGRPKEDEQSSPGKSKPSMW